MSVLGLPENQRPKKTGSDADVAVDACLFESYVFLERAIYRQMGAFPRLLAHGVVFAAISKGACKLASAASDAFI